MTTWSKSPRFNPRDVAEPTTCRCGHQLDRHNEYGCTEMSGASLCKCGVKAVTG